MYPIMVNLENKPVIVIGGGRVASRKINTLLREKARITVVSPTLHHTIDGNAVTWIQRNYQVGDLNEFVLVFACTDNPDINEQIMKDTPSHQLVNNTGNKNHSDFYNVAMIREKDFSISISTDGVSPTRAKEVRQALEDVVKTI